MPGPLPKPPSKRRRANKPASYGLAEPIVAPAAPSQPRELGFDDPHPLVESMWTALQTSAEARFYSAADWVRASMEMWHANQLLSGGKPISPSSWAAVQKGLGDLLVSPSEKRRIGIELKAVGVDADEVAAVAMAARYQQKLRILKPE